MMLVLLLKSRLGQSAIIAVALIGLAFGLIQYGEYRAEEQARQVRKEAIEKRNSTDAEIDKLPEADRRDRLLEWVR